MHGEVGDRLGRVLDAGRALTSELDLDALLERVLHVARELTGARYAAIRIVDERRPEQARFRTSGIDEHVWAAAHPGAVGFSPVRSFLSAPVLVGGEASGHLYLSEKEYGGGFDDDDVHDLDTLAGWAAIGIANARRFGAGEQRRAQLERAVAGMEASMDALAVGDAPDLDHVLDLIADRARALAEADAVIIWLRDGQWLRLAAHAGRGHPPADAAVPVESSTSGRALARDRPERVDDISTLDVPPADYGLPGATSALIVPLVFRRSGLGVLVAFDHVGREPSFSEEDERALRSFAASAATAVTTARSVSRQRLRESLAAAEAERRRWARELHDETLQGLGAVKLALATGLHGDRERARPAVEGAIAELEHQITALRAIITELRPAALDELGLGPAMRSLAARIAERSGLEVRTHLDLGSGRLPPETETVAYRVAQEALTNVVKHAQARTVELTARGERGALVVRIADDGQGIDTRQLHGTGLGLVGMRERAELAAGRLAIASGERGTTVTLTLPQT
jgi:signal transduction histidine kinase